ncbi:hypothetical protein LCL97_14125 [Seohaeicola saemankumensis]|nr:AsmA-like C-terminal region-containing protein [Seohaeicola saemankumensis]MCA0871972.1 hypothetical protein [Seohaeicola saemankumensis]
MSSIIDRDEQQESAGPGPGNARAPRKRSRARHAGVWSLRVSLVLGALALLAAVLVIGQNMRAPDWLRDRVEARLERNMGGLQIGFGDVEFVIHKGWRPRLRLRDVTLNDAEGRPIAALSFAEASLAMRPLLQGQVQPKQIFLSGGSASLRRDSDGAFSLSFSEMATPVGQAATVPQLIEASDRIFQLPQLSALVSVELDGLILRYEDARQGRAWTLDGGHIQLDRKGDDLSLGAGFALLSGRAYASSVEMNYASRIGETEAEFGVVIEDLAAADIAAQSVALAWLDVLRAPISGALRGSVNSAGALGRLSATLNIGAGVVQPSAQARPIPFDGARSYFSYDPAERVLTFDELSVDSAWGSGLAEGQAWLGAVNNGQLTDLTGQFTLSNLVVNPPGLYTEPAPLGRALADFRLELAPFRLRLGQMSLVVGDSTLRLGGDVSVAEGGWTGALDGQVDQIEARQLVALWPEFVAPKPRLWVDENLLAGDLSDIDLALRLRPGAKPTLYADFEYARSDIRFHRFMPPITGATGQTTFIDNRLVTTVTAGTVTPDQGGPLDVAGSSFIIPDTSIKKAAPGIARLQIDGPVTSILSLLNRPPIEVLKGTPLPVDMADGTATLVGTLSVPLKKGAQFGEMQFHLTGEIQDAQSTVLVPGQQVSATALQVEGDQTHIALAGTARIGDLPVVLRWQQPLGEGVGKSSRVSGQVELSPRLVDTFNIGLPQGSVSGQGTGRFTLDLGPDAPPLLAMQSDLRGVGLSLPQLGWRKPQDDSGLLELTGTLGDTARIDQLTMQAAGLSATGSVLNKAGGGLDRALLGSVRLDGWLDAAVELVGRGAAAPDIRILTGSVDLRRAPLDRASGGAAGSGGSGPLRARLDRLQVTNTLALTDFVGDFTTAGGLSGPFSGKLNGQTPVTGRIFPTPRGSAIEVQSADGGGVFRSAGILEQGRGGAFTLRLTPAGTGQFDGVLRVTDTRVKDAPAMAALLNAVSVVGLLDEMAGQGIQFTEVDARFHIGPDRLTLLESSAVGPSIGLSMDGIFDFNSGNLNMRGVISPVYLLNSIGSVLTRKGEGVIGFNYTLTGPADAPGVQVNPLSGLAPGMFREIFRGAPPTTTDGTVPQKREPRTAPDPQDGSAGGR